ncbi:hypothetical protein SEA_GUYFAGIERI_21 [Rhodococcus phage GuyFagieri]|nr:hypothetical protein SEA_GUYFAGIERI_21 [Rhodococcus phage GuyFagieri]
MSGPKIAGVEAPKIDGTYVDATDGETFCGAYGWDDPAGLRDSTREFFNAMWSDGFAKGKTEGLDEALPQYQAVVAEREAAEIKANGLVNENALLHAEMREAARLLRIVTEERDVYRAAIERTIGYRLRLWLLTRLTAKTDRINRPE